MANHEAPHACIYDPVRISPEGNVFNRIDLEKLWDSENGDCQNPDNGRPFHINDIQPQDELRSQLRETLQSQEEYFAGQDTNWQVIPDYPIHLDENDMRDCVNSIAGCMADDIQMPQHSKDLWKAINILRLNCQYSHANTSLFHSVNGFETLIGALDRHFDNLGLGNLSVDPSGRVEMEETLNWCREIVKLVEILVLNSEKPSLSNSLYSIMRMVYFEGGYKKDMGRIIRIMHAMLDDATLPLFYCYFFLISEHLQKPFALSTELSLCADVTKLCLLAGHEARQWTKIPLCIAMGTLVSRFCDDGENNRVNEEYNDRCMALENVMKLLCQFYARFGFLTVVDMSIFHPTVEQLVTKILKHALLQSRPDAQLFNGRHLLLALLLAKYSYRFPDVLDRTEPQDVKIVLDFSMSDLATHYVFNGRPRLKDLADEVASILLDNHPAAEFVLDNWENISY